MGSILRKLIFAVVAWALFFSLLQNKEYIPMARHWINDPLFAAQSLVEEKLSRQERYLLSYYLPGLFSIGFVCKDTASDNVYLPGGTIALSPAQTLTCSNDLKLSTREEAQVNLHYDSMEKAVVLGITKGAANWTLEKSHALVFRTNFLKVKIQNSTFGELRWENKINNTPNLFLSVSGTGAEQVLLQRFLLPNFGPGNVKIFTTKPIVATLDDKPFPLDAYNYLFATTSSVAFADKGVSP